MVQDHFYTLTGKQWYQVSVGDVQQPQVLLVNQWELSVFWNIDLAAFMVSLYLLSSKENYIIQLRKVIAGSLTIIPTLYLEWVKKQIFSGLSNTLKPSF